MKSENNWNTIIEEKSVISAFVEEPVYSDEASELVN